MFCRLIVQEKASGDWRSFITYREEGVLYELRGYGSTLLEAAEDAYDIYKHPVDRDFSSYKVTEHE